MPQVTHEDRLVHVRMPAAAAVLRVGGVLELRERERVVLYAEIRDSLAFSSQVGDERVVRAQHELRPSSALCRELRPAVGQRLELAVAVELIAKEVAEDEHPRIELAGHRHEPRLVDLEDAELARLPARVEQRGGDAPVHIRPGSVAHHRDARALHGRADHGRGGRLPVRGGHQHRPGAEPGAEARDCIGLDAQQEAAGGGRPAAARRADGGPDDPGEPQPEARHQDAGTTTPSTRGATRIFTGRSAIGSPSA